MRKLAVVLLSGGLDSATAASWVLSEGWEAMALSIDYGQAHRRELLSAKAVAEALNIPRQSADARFFASLAQHSALTGSALHALPEGRAVEEMANGDIPITYVPLRNSVFLTLAAAALESWALGLIETERCDPRSLKAGIVIAANALDYSGYPDCRPEFYAAAKRMLNLGAKLYTQYGVEIELLTPLIDLSKADIVRLANRLKAPLGLTWSCYAGGEKPCGVCDSCQLRAKGFLEAGLADPALA
ncbi:7-cyano-7-deazaguanine synthase [Rhodospirillaceae bacterium LM-1]|nr:7-cyano-7-deazaguanine synthase [Rhodospirillaceae bacterium LM-1]